MVIHEKASPVRMRLSVSTGRVTWYVDAGLHRPAIEVACLLARQNLASIALFRRLRMHVQRERRRNSSVVPATLLSALQTSETIELLQDRFCGQSPTQKVQYPIRAA